MSSMVTGTSQKPTRREAIRLILADALVTYGALPFEAPPPMKRDAN